jgi:hypothetical protein
MEVSTPAQVPRTTNSRTYDRNPWIQRDGRFLQKVVEDDIALVVAPGAVVEVCRIGGVAIQGVIAIDMLQALHHRLLDCVL